MTTKEMHIEVGIASQLNASALRRRFSPDEIDWVLNKIINRFVKDCVKPKAYTGEEDFEEFQVSTDKIRSLIVHDKMVRTELEIDRSVAYLPEDYSYLVEDNALVRRACETSSPNPIVSKEVYLSILQFKPSVATQGPYYQGFTLNVNGAVVLTQTDMPTGLSKKDMLFLVINRCKDLLNTKLPAGVRAYWERYGNTFNSNSFVFVSDSLVSTSMAYDTQFFQGQSKSYSAKIATRTEGTKTVNRLTKSDRVGKLQKSAFSKTMYHSPISVLENNTIKVYSDNSFIVTGLVISYVRKPKEISLILGINCDLPEEYHQYICDEAVEFMKLTIEDPSYQAKLQDNKIRG